MQRFLKFDRQSRQGGIVLHCIFAEAGKPRLSVKPRPVGGASLRCSDVNFREESLVLLGLAEGSGFGLNTESKISLKFEGVV